MRTSGKGRGGGEDEEEEGIINVEAPFKKKTLLDIFLTSKPVQVYLKLLILKEKNLSLNKDKHLTVQ